MNRRRQWHPTPVLLPGESHGWRSLVDCNPWRRWGSDTAWATSLSLFTFMHWRRKWQPTPVFLPGESQGRGEPGGLLSMGSHRVGHDWSDLAAAAAADKCSLFQHRNRQGCYSLCLMSTELVRVSGESTKYWTSALEKAKMIDFLNFRRQKPQNNQCLPVLSTNHSTGFWSARGYIFTRSLA